MTNAGFSGYYPNSSHKFGINGDPNIQKQWKTPILDDPILKPSIVSNQRGTITFATSGKNTRTTQLFINYKDNNYLDNEGFTPFGEVMDNGMEVIDRIYSEYKEQPKQGYIQELGNKYLNEEFPKLSFVKSFSVVKEKNSLL